MLLRDVPLQEINNNLNNKKVNNRNSNLKEKKIKNTKQQTFTIYYYSSIQQLMT